jgi:predicted ATPase
MIISRVVLKNWRNFGTVDVQLSNRAFVVGPNASGKSNFLDVFRFLRDIAKSGGGLQKAVSDRGGISKIRCLSARRYPNVEIEVTLSGPSEEADYWRYAIGIKQEPSGLHRTMLAYERIWKGQEKILDRPNEKDQEDIVLLTETHLQHLGSNKPFRKIYDFLNSTLYLHLIPQLLRFPDVFSGTEIPGDPFGKNFLERVAKTNSTTRKSRLRKIESALQIAVPQFKNLRETKDETGAPHLEVVYEHWRPHGAKQWEDQFSDGTLRLMALLWSLLEGESLLLLEEPELSLNAAIVAQIPSLMYNLQRKKKRQVIVSTHSADLLSSKSIGGEEVLLLTPTAEGTTIQVADSIAEVRDLLKAGLSVGDVVIPRTKPQNVHQIELQLLS